jgi:hypothetical protein
MRPIDIQTIYQRMIERGLSARTVRCTHAVLRSALRQALRRRLLLGNPAAFFVPAISQSGSGFLGMLGWFCLGRVSAAPVFFVGLIASRLLARFRRAKRLINYGLLIEVGTYVLVLVAVLGPWHRG